MKKELNKTAEKSCPSVGINWYKPTYGKLLERKYICN